MLDAGQWLLRQFLPFADCVQRSALGHERSVLHGGASLNRKHRISSLALNTSKHCKPSVRLQLGHRQPTKFSESPSQPFHSSRVNTKASGFFQTSQGPKTRSMVSVIVTPRPSRFFVVPGSHATRRGLYPSSM